MKNSENITIHDVGRKAGCSAPTVSRVINNNGYVRDSTRQAVLETIENLGYVPRSNKRGGRGKRNMPQKATSVVIEVIALWHERYEPLMSIDHGQLEGGEVTEPVDEQIIPVMLHNPLGGFFAKTSYGLMEESRRQGYQTVFRGCRDLDSDNLLREATRDDRCGLILLGQDTPSLPTFIERCGKPAVLLGMASLDTQADTVTVDNRQVMSQALEHLTNLGHRRIGYLQGNRSMSEIIERREFFEYEAFRRGINVKPEWIVGSNLFQDSVAEAILLLRRADRPSAIVCCNDQSALAAMRAAAELGISVPDQISVVGVDNTDASSMVTPALTTVAVPFRQIAREAILRIISRVERKEVESSPPFRLMVRPKLIVRDSTGPVHTIT